MCFFASTLCWCWKFRPIRNVQCSMPDFQTDPGAWTLCPSAREKGLQCFFFSWILSIHLLKLGEIMLFKQHLACQVKSNQIKSNQIIFIYIAPKPQSHWPQLALQSVQWVTILPQPFNRGTDRLKSHGGGIPLLGGHDRHAIDVSCTEQNSKIIHPSSETAYPC